MSKHYSVRLPVHFSDHHWQTIVTQMITAAVAEERELVASMEAIAAARKERRKGSAYDILDIQPSNEPVVWVGRT